MVRDNRVTSRKKKGALRWYEVVGGCDDLEQVPGCRNVSRGTPRSSVQKKIQREAK